MEKVYTHGGVGIQGLGTLHRMLQQLWSGHASRGAGATHFHIRVNERWLELVPMCSILSSAMLPAKIG